MGKEGNLGRDIEQNVSKFILLTIIKIQWKGTENTKFKNNDMTICFNQSGTGGEKKKMP